MPALRLVGNEVLLGLRDPFEKLTAFLPLRSLPFAAGIYAIFGTW